MGQRRKAREAAFKLLYSCEQGGAGFGDARSELAKNMELEKNAAIFAEELLGNTIRNMEDIDRLIAECSRNWKLERILPTDRNIIRIAVNELMTETAPPAVVINEAIEISKKFGTSFSGNFVNGILDCIRKKIRNDYAQRS